MKIFYLARINIATQDATTRHVFEFCRQFARMGHQVTLFVPDMGSVRVLEGVRMVYVPAGKKPAITFFLFYALLFFYLPLYFIKIRPQVVYTWQQQMEWLATCWHWILRFSYVMTINGLAPLELKINSAPGWWIRVVEWMEWFCLRMPDLIVTSSPQLRDILCDRYGLSPGKFLVVSNGADPELFKPVDSKTCRQKLHLNLEDTYLVFIGSLKKWHGLEQIILAMVQLAKKFPNMHLLLVGDGEERKKVEALIVQHQLKSRVRMFGAKPFYEIPDYINAADICLGSFTEKPGISPLKVFEYMACGKPLICNSVGGLDALFDEYRVGRLIRSQEPREWVEAIEHMLNHPDQMAEYGQNGLAAVRKVFNWEAICRKIEAAIEPSIAPK